MTINFSSLGALIFALFAASSFAQDPVQSDLLGTWTWTMPKTNCVITRTYRADGMSQRVCFSLARCLPFNTALKVASFGRWTAQNRRAIYLDR